DDRPRLDLVVVLADNPLLAAHVPRAEDLQQIVGVVVLFGDDRLDRGRRGERGGADHGGAAGGGGTHRQGAGGRALVAERQPAGRHEPAQRRGLDLLAVAERL